MTTVLTDRYKNDLQGVLSGYDRVVITCTLPGVCYARSMTSYLYALQIKVFDYAVRRSRLVSSVFISRRTSTMTWM
jgi:hypothetical protein